MIGPRRTTMRGSNRLNILPQYRPEKCTEFDYEEPPTLTTRSLARAFKCVSDLFSWGKKMITDKDGYRPDAGYVDTAWRLVERGQQLAGTSPESPTVAVPGEYMDVPEQSELAPEQPTDTALEPIMKDRRPAHPFYNFLATRPRGVPEELKIPPYELLPPAPEFLPPFKDYPQDEFKYWLQWRYPAVMLFHQLRAQGRMTPYTEAFLRSLGDGVLEVMGFKGIMAEVQDQPEPEWIRQERLADYEAILAARKAARSVPPRVETPKFLAAHAATLAKIEWFKNATVNIADYVPDAATIQKDCFGAASHVATRNDSAPVASAVATQNDAAPTPLPDASQPPPDAAPIVSRPLHMTTVFTETVEQVQGSVRPLKRTWQQMKDVEVGAKWLEPRLTEQRVIEETVPEGDGEDADDEDSSLLKKRRIASTPNGHSDSSPSPDATDVDMDDAPSGPVTKPSTPASPPVSTPTPAPISCPAITPFVPSPVINSSSSSHVG
ncbi:hypothetical protein WOLCODRAFT_150032 [Wolfiporia cocos MD-104 SS10]|uniref:Uncharacterized protein n=1 Tax=Wolfiporia cocos (strain MD-104) TaxID=742152 RepID=A0A2H3JCK2_WOLCO|nr:hypothetical protein WOLCODRAFT_150032 [Wolfiporia cocos MD-104 SS10]